MTFFIEKPSKILQWLNAKGYSGTVEDAFITYVQSGSSLTSGTMEDHLRARLNASGYSGTIDDMLTTMFQAKTGVSNRHDAERQFFQNANLTMFGIGGIDSFTVLMLHMDGSNGSTTFTDSDITPKTITRNGSAIISTAQSVFGGASGLFTAATSDYITTPMTSDFEMGAGDFTIDFRLRLNTVGVTQRICGDLNSAGALYSIICYITSGNLLSFIVSTAGGDFQFTSTNTVSTGTWYHIAFIREGTSLKLYLNGTLETNSSGNANISTNSAKTAQGTTWAIGRNGDYNLNYLDGYIDEFRVSKGIARWTTNFTPPIEAYS